MDSGSWSSITRWFIPKEKPSLPRGEHGLFVEEAGTAREIRHLDRLGLIGEVAVLGAGRGGQ